MKLHRASVQEVKRIAVGTGICLVVMLAAFCLLSGFGIGAFDGRVIVSGIVGSLIALGNFTWLCLTIQNAAVLQDQKAMKAHFQRSYNLRLLLQASWVVAAFLLPGLHVMAAAIPLLFPRVTIYYRQMKKAPAATEDAPPQ